jgi:hypothetical protein
MREGFDHFCVVLTFDQERWVSLAKEYQNLIRMQKYNKSQATSMVIMKSSPLMAFTNQRAA